MSKSFDFSRAPKVLIVEAPFYTDLSRQQMEGACAVLDAAGAMYDVVTVPGSLEIPAAISIALEAEEKGTGETYDAFVVLGIVIRGETFHFDIVAGESARALQDLALAYNIALGNGILTVENQEQAEVRVNKDKKDKGGEAAIAALTMLELKQKMGLWNV